MVNIRAFLIITLLAVDLLARFERASIFVHNVSDLCHWVSGLTLGIIHFFGQSLK
jgi:hypothetical protein